MEKLTSNIPAWHKKSYWRWFGGFVLSNSLHLFLSYFDPFNLYTWAHDPDSTLAHIWDCEKHKNWSLSIIKTVLISSETFMTGRIKYHEPGVWCQPFFFSPCVKCGSRCSTWDGEDERWSSGSDWSPRGASALCVSGVRGYHILHRTSHFILTSEECAVIC